MGGGPRGTAGQLARREALAEQLEEDLTEAGLNDILAVAELKWYSDLTTAEVHTFVGMGLCVSRRLDGWLSCRYCRTSKKRTHCFQGHDQVRAHFTDHDAGGPSVEVRAAPAMEVSEATVASEVRSVWAGAPPPPWAGGDTATRISGAAASVPRPTAATLLTTAVLQPAGARGGGVGHGRDSRGRLLWKGKHPKSTIRLVPGILSNIWRNRQCP